MGDKHQQESFISQLSAHVSLTNTTKLDVKDSIELLEQGLGVQQTRSQHQLVSTLIYYMKLFTMYDMEKATSTTGQQRCQSKGPRNKPLALARQKLYRTEVGQLLWAIPVRPDISFAVKELSRSLQAPTTQQDEKQLQQVLRYLKGTLHFTINLQPPRKRVIERASSIQIQACFDSAWAGSSQTKKATSGVSLSLWRVLLATSSMTQALQAFSLAEAELYAMGMAVQDSLHLKSFLQEVQLSQLAKPFELYNLHSQLQW